MDKTMNAVSKLLAALALAAVALLVCVAPNSAWADGASSNSAYDTPLAQGTYLLKPSCSSSRVVDVQWGSADSGANAWLYSYNGSAAQKWTVTYDANGLYTFVNVNSGKALDAAWGDAHNGTNVQQWDSNGSASQQWIVSANDDGTFTIASALDATYVIDITDWGDWDGANVQLWASSGSTAQRFTAVNAAPSVEPGDEVEEGVYCITNSGSGLSLDVDGGSFDNGTRIQQWAYWGGWQQLVRVQKTADGFYAIRPLKSMSALDVAGGSLMPGARVQQWAYDDGNQNQQWAFNLQADGSYTIVNRANGQALDVSCGSVDNGAQVQTWTANGTAAQCWKLTRTSVPMQAGTYVVRSVADGRVLDLSGGSFANGANVGVWSGNGSAAQVWRASQNSDGTWTLTSVRSFKTLDVANGATWDGANIQQWDSNGSAAQKWTIENTGGDRVFSIKSAASGLALDIDAASGNAQLWTYWGGTSQQFYLEPVSWDNWSGSAELDSILATIVSQQGSNLRTLFDYVVGYSYISGSKYPSGDWAVPFAIEMYNNHGGNCYRFAALFCKLAQAVGYSAQAVQGSVPAASGGTLPHGWVEIYMNGTTYVCDPDMANEMPSRNWYMVTYGSAPMEYYK